MKPNSGSPKRRDSSTHCGSVAGSMLIYLGVARLEDTRLGVAIKGNHKKTEATILGLGPYPMLRQTLSSY